MLNIFVVVINFKKTYKLSERTILFAIHQEMVLDSFFTTRQIIRTVVVCGGGVRDLCSQV